MQLMKLSIIGFIAGFLRAGGAQSGTKSHGVGADRHGRLFGVRRSSYP